MNALVQEYVSRGAVSRNTVGITLALLSYIIIQINGC